MLIDYLVKQFQLKYLGKIKFKSKTKYIYENKLKADMNSYFTT